MASTRQGGAGIGLPLNYPLSVPGLPSSVPGYVTEGSGPITLNAGKVMLIPAGQFNVTPGGYTFVQTKDPVTGLWRNVVSNANDQRYVSSDGANFRVANLTGCAVGAFITNVGSAYTSAPVVTASAGSSAWTAIVGGAVNTTVTVGTAGTLYTQAPVVLFSPPPAGGIQATGYCTLSSDGVGSVTVLNQGAGYTVAPTITFLRDSRDTTGINAAATATLTGSGTITGVICTDHGTPLTAVPTLSFTGGGGASAAATAVMCFTTTGFTVGAGGVAYGNAQPFGVLTIGGIVGGTAGAVVNPLLGSNLFTPRQACISGTSTAGGAITATGAVINDGGLFQSVPLGLVIAGGTGLATTVGQVTMTVGGTTDSVFIQPV